MYAVVLLGFLALASAAPHYHHHHRRPPHYDRFEDGRRDFESEIDRYFEENVFDTQRFWEGLRRDMMNIDQMLADLGRYFPSSVSSAKNEGSEYVITIPLSGYEEKEITVNVKNGFLVVQAVHKLEGQSERNYLDMRTLPDYINEAGSWSFENGILKITFPLKNGEKTDSVTTEVAVTDAPHSREELEPNNGPNDNVNEPRGDIDVKTEVLTNEIPKRTPVEATTYAVDLKNEFELLPARY